MTAEADLVPVQIFDKAVFLQLIQYREVNKTAWIGAFGAGVSPCLQGWLGPLQTEEGGFKTRPYISEFIFVFSAFFAANLPKPILPLNGLFGELVLLYNPYSALALSPTIFFASAGVRRGSALRLWIAINSVALSAWA